MKTVTTTTDKDGRQQTWTEDACQVKHGEAPAARIGSRLQDEEAAGSSEGLRRLISSGFQDCMSIPG